MGFAASAVPSAADHAFERVFSDTGELHERDMPGVYKVRVEIGRDIATTTERIILLDRDAAVDQPLNYSAR